MGRRLQSAWVSPGAVLVCALLGGCATVSTLHEVYWEPIDEQQQQDWPTSETGILHFVDGFPVYGLEQYPSDPYEVLGGIRVCAEVQPRDDGAGEERKVVSVARKNEGQAVLTIKKQVLSSSLHLAQTDYLVITFKTNFLATLVDRINVYLALTAGNSSGYTGPDFQGGMVHYTPEELAAHRAELERAKQLLMARPDFKGGTISTNGVGGR